MVSSKRDLTVLELCESVKALDGYVLNRRHLWHPVDRLKGQRLKGLDLDYMQVL